MAWPSKIYVATINDGVYYTDDFVDPTTQPTWTAINAGLGALDCREFHLDPFHQSDRQYVLIASNNTLYKREYGGNWVDILDVADVYTLTGGIKDGAIEGFCPDPTIVGKLWAAVRAHISVWSDVYVAVYSTDYGNTWHATTPAFGGLYTYGLYSIRAQGDYLYINLDGRAMSWTGNWIYNSDDGGVSWHGAKTGNGATKGISLNKLLPTFVYCVHNDTDLAELTIYIFTNLQAITFNRDDAMWFHPTDDQHQRVFSGNLLHSTADRWATESDGGAISPIPISFAPWAGSDIDQMLVGLDANHGGGENHIIGALYGEADTTTIGIAGANCDTAPFTDSIPYTADMPCRFGIQAVDPTPPIPPTPPATIIPVRVIVAPSLISPTGLDVGLYDRTGTIFKRKLNQYISAYSHTIDAIGGFGPASIGISMMASEALYLFEQLIAGRIKVTCDAGRIVYEGSINGLSLNAGGEAETIGALLDIANRVSVTYSPIVAGAAGSTITSLITEDLESQAKYGIIEKVLSMGQTYDAVTAQAQAVFLREAAYPNRSGNLSLSPGGGQQVALNIECVGLKNWLMVYIYNILSDTYITLDVKMKAIITAEVNNYISRDFSKIQSHSYIVPEDESKDRYAWDILTELLVLGNDVDDNRRNFGVYENGRCIYETIPTTISYRHLLSDPKQCIMDNQAMGVIIPPWLLRPGKYLIVPDFITMGIPDISTNLRKDPRIKFLESVAYTAPYSVDLSGGKTDKLSQMLAKITYSGGSY